MIILNERLTILQLCFLAWTRHHARIGQAAGWAEVDRLNALHGKETNSIWKMNKAKLIEVARMELGMSIAAAEKETTATLREKIRSQRSVVNATEDIHDKLPTGLSSMKIAELLLEVEQRNLPIPEHPTRGKLIVLIRDDVNNRKTLYASPAVTSQPERKTKTRGTPTDQDGDWEVTQPQEEAESSVKEQQRKKNATRRGTATIIG